MNTWPDFLTEEHQARNIVINEIDEHNPEIKKNDVLAAAVFDKQLCWEYNRFSSYQKNHQSHVLDETIAGMQETQIRRQAFWQFKKLKESKQYSSIRFSMTNLEQMF